jgi:hypothetical protein
MSNTFRVCRLPWSIWPWGISLTHSDTDTRPECSVEFGGMLPRPTPPYEELWVRVEFESAAFASAKPHRDDEELAEVTGYDIVPRRKEPEVGLSGGLREVLRATADVANRREQEQKRWIETGACPDPGFYFSMDSGWLEAERNSWAARQRTSHGPGDGVHFLLDGRDGYVEILASGFSWQAWHQGHPRLNEVSGEPIMTGRWADAPSA